MAAQVLSFFQRSPRYAPKPADWGQQELAEFYRVESALIRAGVRVGTDRGLSDENEPWFCFYRSDDGEVVIHFARIDGEYIIAGPAYEEIARGFDFSSLVRNMVARHPLIRRSDSNSNISVHPAALLVAVVGTAFFKTGEARAAESGSSNAQSHHSRPALLSSSSSASLTGGVAPMSVQTPSYDGAQLPANQAVLILAAALLASDYGVDTTSLDANARAAISAAAASLDFGATVTPVQDANGDFHLTATAQAVAMVDNSPVQTVSSVLSLVTLLSTLPLADAHANDSLLTTNNGGHHDSVWIGAPVSNDAGTWAIDVRLANIEGGLPAIEAVQLVRGVIGDVNAQKISVIEVSKLPDILAELIAKGDHYKVPATVDTIPSDIDTSVKPTTPVTPTTPEIKDPATTPIDNGPSDNGPSDSLPQTPEPDQPAPVKPPVIDPAPVYTPAILVKQFVDYFVSHTYKVEVMVKGSEIVMYDARALHDPGSVPHLDSMTFDFGDGSSISLVGAHSAFLNDGFLF